jgi:oxalate decarboxylase/phosphoglucose isomerase-like protein (cupin superfamily)
MEWLGNSADAVYKVIVKPGATAFIPAGWIHAVVRISSTDFAWQRLWQD